MFPSSSKLPFVFLCLFLPLFALPSRSAAQAAPGQTDKVPQPGELGSPFSVDHWWGHVALEVSGGYSPVVNKGAEYFGNGFNVTAGVIDHLSPHWNLLGEVHIFGLNGVNYAPNSGSATVAFDFATAYDLLPRARSSPYVIGGIGYYQFAPGTLCNMVGDCTTISDHSVGYDGGAGVRHRLYAGKRMELFAEVRYHYIASGSTAFGQISLLPVSAGIRW
ncbi:MAG: hypothetical protein ABSG51_12045 [Terracidiphilus sp.]